MITQCSHSLQWLTSTYSFFTRSGLAARSRLSSYCLSTPTPFRRHEPSLLRYGIVFSLLILPNTLNEVMTRGLNAHTTLIWLSDATYDKPAMAGLASGMGDTTCWMVVNGRKWGGKWLNHSRKLFHPWERGRRYDHHLPMMCRLPPPCVGLSSLVQRVSAAWCQ